MKILAVSDVEAKYLYDYYKPGRLDNIDLIIACGDLSREYLEFLVTMSNKPLLYVHGNHDEHMRDPEGCVCIDDRLFVINGVRIVGLPGSYRYREGKYMFTEHQMQRRVARLRRAIARNDGFDILVTHAPARHINDFDNLTHRGFACYTELLDTYKPGLFLHGHIHRNYGAAVPQKSCYGDTTVVNACEYCIVDFDNNVKHSLPKGVDPHVLD